MHFPRGGTQLQLILMSQPPPFPFFTLNRIPLVPPYAMSDFPGVAHSESHLASSTHTLDEEDEDFMDGNSSTSTAGPPPECPRDTGTGRFSRPWNLATTHNCSSGSSSLCSSYHTRNAAIKTGSFHPIQASGRSGRAGNFTSRVFNRTLSNVSASVSPIGSSIPHNQEWGKSFRLFNTSRHLGGASGHRQRDSTHMYRTSKLHMHGKDPDRVAFFNNSVVSYQRQSSVVSATQSGVYSNNRLPESRRASAIFSGGMPYSNAFMIVAGSPTQGLPQHHRSYHTDPHFQLVNYALGGGQRATTALTPSQTEIWSLLSTMRTYLALRGDTILVGDSRHPLEIKRGGLIGSGGFAKVYVGINTVKGELVAIKEMQIEDVDDFKTLKTIEQEFALLKSLHHPNIVSYHLFEHSRSQKVCRIVMELLAGDSTLHLLQKFGPLTEAILRKLARHLLHAIAFIHKEGIFHRDIKPANILVSHQGVVKLCDFGCSKRLSELSKASSCIIGTPVYMAPELIKGEDNHRADIWSMACSLFELGTGLQPWYHSGVKDNLPLMFYITTTFETPLVMPTQDNVPDFSAEFMHFLELCFTRDPDRRPEAAELLRHPWVTDSRSSCVSPRFPAAFFSLCIDSQEGGGRHTHSPTKPLESASPRDSALSNDDSFSDTTVASVSVTQPIDDEVLCQQELEEVAATIAVDLCSTLMNLPESAIGNLERRLADATSGTCETNPSLVRIQSVGSPSLSHRERGPVSVSVWDYTSPNGSPEHSILQDNFHYSHMQLGSSAGNFVLPGDIPEVPQQQYLRINEEGNLDFATVAEVELESLADTVHMKSGSVDSSLFAVSHNSRLVSPVPPGSFSRGSTTPAQFPERHVSPHSSTPGYSRGESPSRGAPLPHPIPILHPNFVYPPSDSSQSHSPLSVSTSSLRYLPDRAKPQLDGKLRMSFAVNTAPGQELNVELKVDVADVHCKIIDNHPNYFVALSDDVKGQITAKIKEAAASSACASPVRTTPTRTKGNSGQFDLPRAPAGTHFFNSPSYRASRSPARPLSRLSMMSSTSQAPLSPGATPGFLPSSADGASASASHASTPAPSSSSALNGILNLRQPSRLSSSKTNN